MNAWTAHVIALQSSCNSITNYPIEFFAISAKPLRPLRPVVCTRMNADYRTQKEGKNYAEVAEAKVVVGS